MPHCPSHTQAFVVRAHVRPQWQLAMVDIVRWRMLLSAIVYVPPLLLAASQVSGRVATRSTWRTHRTPQAQPRLRWLPAARLWLHRARCTAWYNSPISACIVWVFACCSCVGVAVWHAQHRTAFSSAQSVRRYKLSLLRGSDHRKWRTKWFFGLITFAFLLRVVFFLLRWLHKNDFGDHLLNRVCLLSFLMCVGVRPHRVAWCAGTSHCVLSSLCWCSHFGDCVSPLPFPCMMAWH